MPLNKSALRAVLFDFDGTLVDSYGAIAASVNHVREAHGLPPLSVNEIKGHVGRGLPHLLTQTVPGGDIQRDAIRYRAHHPSVMRELTVLLPGAREALAAVKQGGLRSGIVSNKPRLFTAVLVEHLDLSPLVDVVVGPEDVRRPKPAPDMMLAALARLEIPAHAALYVGDMTVDIQSARAAGTAVWIVPTGSDAREAIEAQKPDRLLENLTELAAWLALP